jgi:hypothetical protein
MNTGRNQFFHFTPKIAREIFFRFSFISVVSKSYVYHHIPLYINNSLFPCSWAGIREGGLLKKLYNEGWGLGTSDRVLA